MDREDVPSAVGSRQARTPSSQPSRTPRAVVDRHLALRAHRGLGSVLVPAGVPRDAGVKGRHHGPRERHARTRLRTANQYGETVRLSDFRGRKAVALVFFPLAFSGHLHRRAVRSARQPRRCSRTTASSCSASPSTPSTRCAPGPSRRATTSRCSPTSGRTATSPRSTASSSREGLREPRDLPRSTSAASSALVHHRARRGPLDRGVPRGARPPARPRLTASRVARGEPEATSRPRSTFSPPFPAPARRAARERLPFRPARLSTSRAFSSAGRAPRLHRGCRRFDPGRAHLHAYGRRFDAVPGGRAAPSRGPLWLTQHAVADAHHTACCVNWILRAPGAG